MRRISSARPVLKHGPLVLLTDGILLFLTLYGAVFSFSSGFSLQVDARALLAVCGVCAALFLTVFSLPRFRWLALLAAAAFWALALCRLWDGLVLGEISIRCSVVNTAAESLGGIETIVPIAQLPGETWVLLTTLTVSAAAFLLAGVLGLFIVRLRAFWPVFGLSLLFPAAPLILTVTPDWLPLMALLCAWCAMGVPSLAGRRDPAGGVRLTLLALPAAAVLLALLTVAMPRESYQRPAWADRANASLTDWATRVSERLFPDADGPGTLAAADTNIDLSQAGPLRYSGRTVLKVETELRGRIYLRGFSAGVYEDSRWQPLSEEAYGELNWGGDPPDPGDSPLLSGSYQLSYPLDGFQPMNFPALADRDSFSRHGYAAVTVENLGADPGYVYCPYQLLSTPEQVNGTQFVYDSYLAREEGVWKHTLYVMPQCDPLSGADLPGEARLPEQYYSQFVYNHYLDVPEELQETLWRCLYEIWEHPEAVLPGGTDNEHYQRLIYGSFSTWNELALEYAALIADYLGETAVYDPDTPAAPEGADSVEYFLTERREGYCMHFASAAALLLRTAGIPTRYVSGYVADIPASGKANVPDSNAHAWVEIYLEGYGWEPVEVTPAYAGNQPGRSGTAAAAQPTASPSPMPSASAEPSTPKPVSTPKPTPQQTEAEFSLPFDACLLWIPALLLAGAASLLLRRRLILRRRARRWNGPNPNRAAIDAYVYLVRLSRWGGQIPPQAEALAKKARFSQHRLSEEERSAVLAAAREQAVEVSRKLPRWKRLFCRLLPALF